MLCPGHGNFPGNRGCLYETEVADESGVSASYGRRQYAGLPFVCSFTAFVWRGASVASLRGPSEPSPLHSPGSGHVLCAYLHDCPSGAFKPQGGHEAGLYGPCQIQGNPGKTGDLAPWP